MTPSERFHFVQWAERHHPGFTTDPAVYRAAMSGWKDYLDQQHILAALSMSTTDEA